MASARGVNKHKKYTFEDIVDEVLSFKFKERSIWFRK